MCISWAWTTASWVDIMCSNPSTISFVKIPWLRRAFPAWGDTEWQSWSHSSRSSVASGTDTAKNTLFQRSGMFRARPRRTVPASGLARPDCAGPARPSQPITFIDRALRRPNPQLFTFIDRAWAGLAPKPSLLSTGPRLARPPSPHFYRQGPGQPGLPTPHFYWRGQPAQPLTSIGQTLHFY